MKELFAGIGLGLVLAVVISTLWSQSIYTSVFLLIAGFSMAIWVVLTTESPEPVIDAFRNNKG